MANKEKKSVTLSTETIITVQKMAKQESRSFSQMVEILVKQQLNEIQKKS